MFKSGKFSLSSFNQLFRLLIAAIFLIGILPVPALASTNGTIAGQVTDNTTGNPIPDATIGILEVPDDPPSWSGNTDVDGNYSIPVPEGTGYIVAASKSGYVPSQVTGQSVTANATTTANLTLVQGATIQGTVTDNSTQNPIQGVDVWAYEPATPEVRYDATPTDASGYYSLLIPPGTGYTVKAAINGYVDAIQTGVDAFWLRQKQLTLLWTRWTAHRPPRSTTSPPAVPPTTPSPSPGQLPAMIMTSTRQHNMKSAMLPLLLVIMPPGIAPLWYKTHQHLRPLAPARTLPYTDSAIIPPSSSL